MPSRPSGSAADSAIASASASSCAARPRSSARSSRFVRPSAPVGPSASRCASSSACADHLVVRHHCRDQPQCERLGRVEHPVGEQDVPRAGRADGPRERPGQPAVRREPDRGIRRAQPRRDARHRDVRGHHQAHPRPGGPAPYCSDHRHRHLDQRAHELVQLARERPHGRTRSAVSEPAAASAPTSAPTQKCGPSPCEQHGADVRLQCAQRRVHRTQLVEVEGSVPRSAAHGAAQHPPGPRDGDRSSGPFAPLRCPTVSVTGPGRGR